MPNHVIPWNAFPQPTCHVFLYIANVIIIQVQSVMESKVRAEFGQKSGKRPDAGVGAMLGACC